MASKIILIGALFIIIIASGLWLSRMGRPLNTTVFSIHKIVSVGVFVWIVIMMYRFPKGLDLPQYYTIIFAVAGFSGFLVFISGVLLSFDKFENVFTTAIHKISAILLVISIAVSIYLLHRLK